jgi:prepilin-type N-terminal cleavage/methylation domain-containing protein
MDSGIDKRHGQEFRKGFSLLELMVVTAIIALLASTTFLSVVRAREQTQRQNIINNLKKIEAAKSQWAIENGRSTGSTPTMTDLAPFFGGNTFPAPVASETYFIGAIGSLPYADTAMPIGTETRFAGIN